MWKCKTWIYSVANVAGIQFGFVLQYRPSPQRGEGKGGIGLITLTP